MSGRTGRVLSRATLTSHSRCQRSTRSIPPPAPHWRNPLYVGTPTAVLLTPFHFPSPLPILDRAAASVPPHPPSHMMTASPPPPPSSILRLDSQPDKLSGYYDCLDSSLPPPLPATAAAASLSASNPLRRLHHVKLHSSMQHVSSHLSPMTSPISPYAPTDDSSEGGSAWSVAPLSRRRESVPEWLAEPPSPSMRAAPFPPPPHSLPPAQLRQLSDPAASPWTAVSTSPASTQSSNHSWASAAMSPSSPAPLPPPASLSPSSTWSSPSSASPVSRTFSFSPSTEPQPPRRRYQRTPGLSREQRAERRRQSHRELDAVRRHRDAAAITRLGQLTATSPIGTHSRAQQPPPQPHRRGVKREHDADRDNDSDDKKGKRHRTAVLEQSVEQMEELQILVDRLATACAQQCADITALRLQLLSTGAQPQPAAETAAKLPHMMPLLSSSITRRLAGELGVCGLYNSYFMSPAVGMMLVDCATGVVLDVNERLLKGGLCSREDIIGRQIAPTFQAVITGAEWDIQSPPSQSSSNGGAQGQGSSGDNNSSVYHQYGVTKQSVLALYRGQVDQIYVMWRALLGDGLAYELPLNGFIASRDDKDGGRPRTVMVSLSLSEAKRI